MTDLALAERHRRDQLVIRAGTLTRFRRAWRLLTLTDLRGTFEPWLEVVEPIIRAGHDQSAASSRRFYLEARGRAFKGLTRFAEQGPRFDPGPVELDSERVRRALTVTAIGTATKARRSGLIDLDDRAQVAATRAAGRLALAGGRETIERAVEADPVALGYMRVTDGNPCAFCAMLASRGPVYRSAESAGGAFDARGNVVAFHDGCGCSVVPVFSSDTPWPASSARFDALWRDSTAGLSGDDARRAFRRALEGREAR